MQVKRLCCWSWLALCLLLIFGWTSKPAAAAANPELSGRIAFAAQGNIFTLDLATNDVTQLTQDGLNNDPAWSPDGKQIAFVHLKSVEASQDIYLMNSDGSGAKALATTANAEILPAWGPDGALWYVVDDHSSDYPRIEMFSVDEKGVKNLVHSEATALCTPTNLSISPVGVPALTLNCGRGNYVYGLNLTTGKLDDLLANVKPELQGCADSGVWAHEKPTLAVLFRAGCVLDAHGLWYSLDFTTTPARSKQLATSTQIDDFAWSWDDQQVAFANGAGLWLLDASGQAQQLSTHGDAPSWAPGPSLPGMPVTGAVAEWPLWLALAALGLIGLGLFLSAATRRVWSELD